MIPRVSVVIPAYQASRWVGRTVASVRAQTLTDIEILIVDDGSTDDLTGALAPHLADPRLRVIRQDNRGLAGARNRGLEEAAAALVAPLDADDLWHPDFLEACVAALDAAQGAPFAFAYSFRMDEEDKMMPLVLPGEPFRHDLLGLLWLNTVGSGSAGVYRRDAMLAVGGYDEAMGRRGEQGAEDWKLILQLARRADPVLVPRYLVGYRLVMASMSMANPRRQLDAILAVLREVQGEMPDVDRRHFRDGRTMMTACLLPVFARRGRFGDFFKEMWLAYSANPLWFRSAFLRRAHLWRAKSTLQWLLHMANPLRRPRAHLSEVRFEGALPFAFLGEGRTADG